MATDTVTAHASRFGLVGALAITQTAGYGVLYYSIAPLLSPMSRHLGISKSTAAGALTVAVLVSGAMAIPVGRWLDPRGGRAVMTGDAYLATDANGYPVHPEWHSDEFSRMVRQAGLPRIRLHDSRHTTLSLMEKAGVPISIISKWAGHADPAFTYRTYVHSNEEDLEVAGRSLARLHKIA